jgi:type IV pilus assembly protein PilV
MSKALSSARGFTLVEALVALVVLAIGMLGIAGLYVESLRASRTALTRTEAVVLAADMADRIRANPLGNYAKAADDAGTINAACAPGGAGCTADQLALHDIAQWVQVVDDRYDAPASGRRALPGGRGEIAVDTTTIPRTYTITISWDESGERTSSGAAVRSSYVLRFQI